MRLRPTIKQYLLPLVFLAISVLIAFYSATPVSVRISVFAICICAAYMARYNTKLSVINANLINDVQEHQDIQADLIESKTRLKAIIDQSIAGIFVLDPESHIIMDANQSALDMLGSDKESVVGRKCHHFICPAQKGHDLASEDSPILDRSDRLLIRSDGTVQAIVKKVMPFEVYGKPYLSISFIDISELKETQANLESALAAADEANKFKDYFLANMSHELRTPMNGIIGMTGILQNSNLTDEQAEFTQIIMKSSEGLLNIINDILDYAHIDTGQTKLNLSNFDLLSVINGEINRFTSKIKEKGLVFSHLVEDEVPPYLKGDAQRIKKLIRILISNAVKFTHQGAISLHVALAENKEHECVLYIKVKDTGIGISPERKKQIFNPFFQVDNSSTRQFCGAGLGLALAKHFSEMMGGRVGVETTQGIGSTFWFTIRLEKQKTLARQTSLTEVNISDKRILIVDDNDTNRQVLINYLKSWNLRYTAVEDARSALAALHRAVSKKDPYDLTIIDHMMPEMDGVDLGRAIKKDPLLNDIRMILFTSIDQGYDKDHIKTVGFDAFIAKPIRSSRLLNCIKMVCNQPKRNHKNETHTRDIVTPEALKEAEASGPRILVVEDNVINQKVMLKILSNIDCQAKVVNNGRKAVHELCQNSYDLVLMDLQMPEMNGFEATSAIRNPLNKCLDPQIPIIAVTANAIKGDRKRCMEAGMDDYLPKPVSPDNLKEKIQYWLDNRQTLSTPETTVFN